ncbi:unnamed protein product, partial [Prorocentrum cordatum]
ERAAKHTASYRDVVEARAHSGAQASHPRERRGVGRPCSAAPVTPRTAFSCDERSRSAAPAATRSAAFSETLCAVDRRRREHSPGLRPLILDGTDRQPEAAPSTGEVVEAPRAEQRGRTSRRKRRRVRASAGAAATTPANPSGQEPPASAFVAGRQDWPASLEPALPEGASEALGVKEPFAWGALCGGFLLGVFVTVAAGLVLWRVARLLAAKTDGRSQPSKTYAALPAESKDSKGPAYYDPHDDYMLGGIRTAQGPRASDAGVVDHHFLSVCMQELTTHDQPHAGERVVSAILRRRYQLLEVLHASSLRKDEDDQDAKAWLDERHAAAAACGGLESPPRIGEAPGLGASLQGRRGARDDEAPSLGFGNDGLVQRDALPIPLDSETLHYMKGFSALNGELPLGQRRKAARCRRQERWMLEGVAALNELGGGGRAAGCGGRLSLAPRSALRHLAEVHASSPPKTEVRANQEAFQALLGLRPGYADEPAIGAKAGYQRGKVSLPPRGAGKVDLVRLLPLHLQSALGSGRGLLRSEQGAFAALDEADVACYVDSELAQRGIDYGRFLLELFEAGIVEVLDYESERKEETGIFFAPRKEVHLAAGDVEVCFYQYLLPGWARNYFCQPDVATQLLPARLREALGQEGASRPRTTFRARVVPMGWNWAVHLVQAAHLNVLASVSPDNQWLVDKQPGAFLSDSTVVNDMLDTFTTEGVRATLDLDDALLGIAQVSKAARWRPASKKFCRVHGCIQYLLEARRCITGRQLERLVGHVAALLFLRREALSMLRSVYVFIRSTYDKAQPLWASCQQELRWVLALLPTAFADMKRPWHAEVGTFDASSWGGGGLRGTLAFSARCRPRGRQPEKLRFRGPLATLVAPRDAALAADAIELSDPAAPLLGRAAGFAEVNTELLWESNWVTAVAC